MTTQEEMDEIRIRSGLITREQLAEARRLDALSEPEWLAHDISLDHQKTELYAGKTVKDIRFIGNGQEVITFTDETRLLYSVECPESGADLHTNTYKEFNFETWKYREERSLGLIEVSGIRRVVINRRRFFVRVSPTRPEDKDNSWVQQTNFEVVKSDFIRLLSDHQMMIRVRSYMSGRKFRTHRIFVSGDTVNIVKRDVALSSSEAYDKYGVN